MRVNFSNAKHVAYAAVVPLAILASSFSDAARADEVRWEEQAERLQKVSAAFLDYVPTAEPVRSGMGLELKTVISFLPKTDPTIGGKTEEVPSAPAHLIPTLQFNHDIFDGALGYQVWGGYLIPGAEGLLGLDAKLTQSVYGMAVHLQYDMSFLKLYLPIGYQSTHAKIVGAITEKGSDDKFDTKSSVTYFALGGKLPQMGLWFNFMYGAKKTDSTFDIEVDKTSLETKDSPSLQQLSLGWQIPDSGIQLGYSQLYIPERLTMPRLLAGYQYTFDK